jgi:hypothetical protein
VENDQDVLNNRVDMVPLWDVQEKESATPENPHVLAEKPLSIVFSEVFEEALVEYYVEGEIGKWQ